MKTKEEMLEIMKNTQKKPSATSEKPSSEFPVVSIEEKTLKVLEEIRNGILELRRIFLGEGV